MNPWQLEQTIDQHQQIWEGLADTMGLFSWVKPPRRDPEEVEHVIEKGEEVFGLLAADLGIFEGEEHVRDDSPMDHSEHRRDHRSVEES